MVGKKEKQGFKAMFKRMLASRLAAELQQHWQRCCCWLLLDWAYAVLFYLKVNRRNWDLKTLGNWPHKRPIVRR